MLLRKIIGKNFVVGVLSAVVVSAFCGANAYADAVTAGQEDCTQQQLDSLHAKAGVMDNGTCVATVCVNGYELVDKVCVAKGSGCDSGLLNTVHATTGYMQDDVCIPTECMNGYNLIEDNGKKLCKFMGEGCSQVALTAVYATAGYMSDERCVPTVCMSGYELEEGRCVRRGNSGSGNQGGGAVVTADCGKNLFNPQLLIEAGLTSYNTSTYTFTGRFTRDYSTSTKANTGEFTGNHYMSNYSYGLVPNTTYELVYTIKCDTDSNSVNSKDMIIGLKTKSGNTVDEVAPTVDACSNGVATATATAGGGGVSVTGVYVGRAAGTSADFNGELNISNVMLVLNSENTNSMIPYGPCIKVSTKASTATRAAGVESRLSNLRDMIDHLISRTQASAIDINSLDSEKQTRPADESTDSCQTGDSCLLIKDASGTNHWYRIETCNADSVLSNVGTQTEGNVSWGNGEPFGWKTSTAGVLMCGNVNSGNTITGCQNDEWVTAYNVTEGTPDKMVFGTARRVAIAERTLGQIVTLPNNVADGDICVCKATRYKLWNSDTSSFGASQTITTDKWLVYGVTASYTACLDYCADDRDSSKGNYLANISNTCNGGGSMANMCQYHTFFDTVAEATTSGHHFGWIGNSAAQEECGNDGIFYSNAHCSTASSNEGAWIAQYNSSTSSDIEGYVYGICGFATVPSGTAVGDIVDMNISDVSQDVTGHNATVCMVKGYKATADATETDVSLNKALVVEYENFASSTAIRAGANALQSVNGDLYPDVRDWYRALADICVAY